MSESLPDHNKRVLGTDGRVRIPKGTMVKRYGPDWPIKEEPSKRSMTVTVHAVLGPYDHSPGSPARVEWLGRGGYSRTALIQDVEAA